MTSDAGGSQHADCVFVLNPRSGNQTVERFGLIAKAEQLGARVELTTAERGAASLARQAVEAGARRLGVAGGDGTVAAVASVAAEAGLPLIVVPAGTRNHFAADLGLDIKDPARAMHALLDPDPVRVDLGAVQSHTFVNNVSFGLYAEALLEPGYREAKARSFASVTPGFLDGQRFVDARIDTPSETLDCPQVVLVSNNPYHLANLRTFGQRLSLSTGMLGAIVMKRQPDPPPPSLVAKLRKDLRRTGGANFPGSGVLVWSATEVTLSGSDSTLPAGIDGEAVELQLPITCRVRPGALTVHLPKERPGAPKVNGTRGVSGHKPRTAQQVASSSARTS